MPKLVREMIENATSESVKRLCWAYSARIIELCRKADTVSVIFETWVEKVKAENQIEMSRRYQSIANENDALLAPIGEVWSAVMDEVQDVFGAYLYFKDDEHSSVIWDYLVAMVLTKVITGNLPK